MLFKSVMLHSNKNLLALV